MRFTEDGYVEGGIECGVRDADGIGKFETVIDIEKWVLARVSDFVQAKPPGVAGNELWIGCRDYPFVELSRRGKVVKARYWHPDFNTRVGFISVQGTFESTSIPQVVHDILNKARQVDLEDWYQKLKKDGRLILF